MLDDHSASLTTETFDCLIDVGVDSQEGRKQFILHCHIKSAISAWNGIGYDGANELFDQQFACD